MQTLIALTVMGLIGAVASILAAASALIGMAPLLIVALIAVGVLRRRRRGPRPCGVMAPVLPRPAPAPHPMPVCPDGWLLFPIWRRPEDPAPRSAVLDAEIISIDEHHG